MQGSSSDLRFELPCNRQAPAAVREAIRALDVGWVAADAMLVASELVTNAVIHSGCASNDLLEVRIQLTRDRLLISVRDPGCAGGAARLREDDDAFGGIGLRVVEQLARHWSYERADGHRVWAELTRA